MSKKIYTIGHSNHSIEYFLNLLENQSIEAIVDVRSYPFSKFAPHFNKEELKSHLASKDIKYVFLGNELGGRPDSPECYLPDGTVDYEKVMSDSVFLEGIDRVKNGAEDHTIALMCSENDPLKCHRTMMVGRHLKTNGYEVINILKDGSLEAQEEVESKILSKVKTQRSLFSENTPETDLLSEAYRLQSNKIAYKRQPSPAV